jgi:hypothetical protein
MSFLLFSLFFLACVSSLSGELDNTTSSYPVMTRDQSTFVKICQYSYNVTAAYHIIYEVTLHPESPYMQAVQYAIKCDPMNPGNFQKLHCFYECDSDCADFDYKLFSVSIMPPWRCVFPFFATSASTLFFFAPAYSFYIYAVYIHICTVAGLVVNALLIYITVRMTERRTVHYLIANTSLISVIATIITYMYNVMRINANTVHMVNYPLINFLGQFFTWYEISAPFILVAISRVLTLTNPSLFKLLFSTTKRVKVVCVIYDFLMCFFFPVLLCCMYSMSLIVPQQNDDVLWYYKAFRFPFETGVSLFFAVSAAALGYLCQKNVSRNVAETRSHLKNENTLADTKLIMRWMWVTLAVQFLFNFVQLILRIIQDIANICYYFYPDVTVGFCGVFNANELIWGISNVIWWCITALLYAKPTIDGLVTAYFCLPYRRGIAQLFGCQK